MDGGGIEGAIHAMHLIWKHNIHEEDRVLILMYAWHGLNKENRMEILWDVQYKWPSGT